MVTMATYTSRMLLGYILVLKVTGEPQPAPQPQPQPAPEAGNTSPEQELLTRYLLSRILEKDDLSYSEGPRDKVRERVGERRDDQDSSPSIVYPQVSQQSITTPLRRLLQKAKENIEVIDFRKPSVKNHNAEQIRKTRMPEPGYYTQVKEETTKNASKTRKVQRTAPSESIPTFLPFPGTEPNRPLQRCADCVGEGSQPHSRFSMPLAQLGDKKYYLGIFFKANWYKAEQYCRFHGMHLASINSGDEQKNLEEHIQSFGKFDSLIASFAWDFVVDNFYYGVNSFDLTLSLRRVASIPFLLCKAYCSRSMRPKSLPIVVTPCMWFATVPG